MSSSDGSRPILTPDARTILVERVRSVSRDLGNSGGAKEKGTSLTDQATLDDGERDRQAREADLHALEELLEDSLIVQPGEDLSEANTPCFVILSVQNGNGVKNEAMRLLYDQPHPISIPGCSVFALGLDSPIGKAIVGQSVHSTHTVKVNDKEQSVTIKRIQEAEEVGV